MNNKGGPAKNSINPINSSNAFKSNDSEHLQPTRKKAIDSTNMGASASSGSAFHPPHDLKLQSQEKKAGDRQSVPNIDDNTPINVQLYNETEDDKEDRPKKVDLEDKNEDVRSLLEYLYLDVKVRSPSEVRSSIKTKIGSNYYFE